MLGLMLLGGAFFLTCCWLDTGNGNEEKDLINLILKESLGKDEVYPYVKEYRGNSYYIELPFSFEFAQLQKLQGKIENAIKKRVSITNNDFNYCIKVVDEVKTAHLVPFQLIDTKKEKGIKLAIGMTGNDLVYLNFDSVPHLLVGGVTGWGKSVFTKSLIVQIINNYPDCQLDLFDFKYGVEFSCFKDLKQTKNFITEPECAQIEIERIHKEIGERFNVVREHGCNDIFELNSKSNNKMQYKFVIIEELMTLLQIQKKLSVTLTQCLSTARAVGIYFIFTSQRFSADILDAKIKANIDNRVCFHVTDGINSRVILDTQGAEKLQIKGRGILSQSGVQQEFQSFFIEQKDIDAHIKAHLKDKKSVPVPKKEGIKKEGMIWE